MPFMVIKNKKRHNPLNTFLAEISGVKFSSGFMHGRNLTPFLKEKIMNEEKMKIEIWSDIACPFCFIGKRQLENALKSSPFKSN